MQERPQPGESAPGCATVARWAAIVLVGMVLEWVLTPDYKWADGGDFEQE